MAVILDLTHNAMSKVLSNHTIMSGIHENPIVDTKIMFLCQKCRKWSIDILTLQKWRPSLILPTMQCPK